MQLIRHNPSDGIYATTPDYIHALELRAPRRLLYISGTMGLDGRGVAGRTLAAQLELIWSNIGRILAGAEMSVENIVRVTSYLRDASYAEANQNARSAALRGHVVPTTAVVVQTLAEDWLVEVEIVAAA